MPDPADDDRVTDLDEAAAEFQRVRPRLFGIAYRMLWILNPDKLGAVTTA